MYVEIKLSYRRWIRRFIAFILFVASVCVIPRLWCARGADGFFDANASSQEALVKYVCFWIENGLSQHDFKTGSHLFNNEWYFGTYQMSALGILQFVRAHPEKEAKYLPFVETCLDRIMQKDVYLFDERSWREPPLRTLDKNNGHVAYLGYFNLALSFYRQVASHPKPKFTEVNDAITSALARRFGQSPTGLLETYPGETYPIDNTAALSSIGLYDKITGSDHGELVRKCLEKIQIQYTDSTSGLLVQSVNSSTGCAVDKPRASGTALAAYFLSFSRPDISKDFYHALKKCSTKWIGFGLVREYPANVVAGWGDIDSGPVVFGMSCSGTGFTIGPARIHKDRDFFTALYRTAYLIGTPLETDESLNFVCGGPLGNAIMLAMLTAGEKT